MNRVIAYNRNLAHIPGRAIAAIDFLLRMQTAPNQNLGIQLIDSITVNPIKIDLEDKRRAASMSCIETLPDRGADMRRKQMIPEELIASLYSNDVQNSIPNFSALLKSASKEHIEVHVMKKSVNINSIQRKIHLKNLS